MRSAAIVLAASAAVLLAAVTACGDSHGARGARTGPAGAPTTARELPRLLAQFPTTIAADAPVSFSAESVLAETPGLEDQAGGVRGSGASSVTSLAKQLKDDLHIDLLGADALVTVGNTPDRVVLVSGGQDGRAITEAAEEHGWSGTKVLAQDLDPSSPLTVYVHQIKVEGDSVYLGGHSADLSAGPGRLPATIKNLTACLGDSPILQSDTTGAAHVAVGLKAGSADGAVLCAEPTSGSDPRVLGQGIEASIKDDLDLTRVPYAERMSVDRVSYPTKTTARVDVRLQGRASPGLPIAMLVKRDLPGLRPAG